MPLLWRSRWPLLVASIGTFARAFFLSLRVSERARTLNPATGRRVRKQGFALLLFSFDGPELTWLSNADREDMIRLLEEILQKFKTGQMTDFPGGIDATN